MCPGLEITNGWHLQQLLWCPVLFAVVPSARFQYKLLPVEVPLTIRKLLYPFKSKVQDLCLMKLLLIKQVFNLLLD